MTRPQALLLALLCSCATARGGRDQDPFSGLPTGASAPAADCAPMQLPAGERRAHLFSVVFVVRVDGSVADARVINPIDPQLKQLAVAWLTGCHHRPAMLDGKPVAVRQRRELLVRPAEQGAPRLVEAAALPKDARESIRPMQECATRLEAQRFSGQVHVSFTVQPDGATSDVTLEGRAPEPLSTALQAWIAQCPYRSVEVEGEPVAVRVRKTFLFDDGRGREWDSDEAPPPPGPKMSRPLPDSSCGHPSAPGLHGTVVLEYVVGADGRPHDFKVRNPDEAPLELVSLVEEWLSKCHYTPSMAGGKPVPVKVIQPFIFH